MGYRHSANVAARTALFVAGLVTVASCGDKPCTPTAPCVSTTTTFTVRAVVPAQGAELRATPVTISGSGFVTGVRVTVDGVEVAATLSSSVVITVTVPAHAAGNVAIVVTNPDGASAPVPNGFTYMAPSPITVTGLSPDNVLVTGGMVMINGAGFLSGVSVTIDHVPVSPGLNGSSKIVVTAPPHVAGAVDVSVTNPFSEPVVLTGALTYKPLPPIQLSRVEPLVGSTAGGTLLAIYGTSIHSGARATIDGQTIAGEIGDFEALYVDLPPHAAGPVDIVVTNPDGQMSRLTAGFTYAQPETFSFDGDWGTYVRPSWADGPGFKVANGTVTRLTCGFQVINLIPTPPPPVSNGAFSFTAPGGGQFTGHVVANGEATGTTTVPGCPSGTWYAYRR